MNPLESSSLLGLGAALAGAWTLVAAVRHLYVTAQPDEWLLCLRDGRLVRAGVGVSVLRRPGDVVVRFSSTMQRVAFAVDALTLEHLAVRVEGFIFWSVSPDGDAPLRAYSRLGIANLLRPPPALRHPKHLLTSPQHKAFQQILSAVVQRHASTQRLDALIGSQDALVEGLTARLRDTTAEMGVRIDQVEVLTARPSDDHVLAQLSAAETERLREASQALRREASARIDAADLARATELQHAKGEAQRRLDAEADAHEIARALERSRARIAREREELDAKLAAVRAEAEAARDAELCRADALERTSPAVREHERQLLVAEKIASSLKVTDARWVSVGANNPVASVGAMIAGVREILGA